jgi:hypothetical protein
MGETHGPESTDSDRSFAEVFTPRLPFALAWVDEFWGLSVLHGQFVRPCQLFSMSSRHSIRHVRGNDNALLVAAQLAPIAPTGTLSSVRQSNANGDRRNRSASRTNSNHSIPRRSHFPCVDDGVFCRHSSGCFHPRGGFILGVDVHESGGCDIRTRSVH